MPSHIAGLLLVYSFFVLYCAIEEEHILCTQAALCKYSERAPSRFHCGCTCDHFVYLFVGASARLSLSLRKLILNIHSLNSPNNRNAGNLNFFKHKKSNYLSPPPFPLFMDTFYFYNSWMLHEFHEFIGVESSSAVFHECVVRNI